MSIHPWVIPGADGLPIIGDTHLPAAAAKGVVLLAHGFKGYKDYGFFPYLGEQAAAAGLIAHRFNFSHSGMTQHIETFERADLFEKDTWSKQIHDLRKVAAAAEASHLPGERPAANTPTTWFGHSRGGMAALLAAALAGTEQTAAPDRLGIAAAPHANAALDDDQRRLLHSRGRLESPSSRTGQMLYVGRGWYDEIEAAPRAYDPVEAISLVNCPVLLIYGNADETVPADAGRILHQAAPARTRLEIIEAAGHTFNAPNPLPLDGPIPPQTEQLAALMIDFALETV